MNAKAVFGEPVQQGSVTLIPVASVTYGFGIGQGWGRGPKGAGAPKASRHRAGAKERAREAGEAAWPARLGYIRIDETARQMEPTMNMTLVSIGGMLDGCVERVLGDADDPGEGETEALKSGSGMPCLGQG